MMLRKLLLSLLFFPLMTIFSYGQTFSEKLALQYAQEGECEKAISLFTEQVKNNTANNSIYIPYLKCLEEKKDFKTARELCAYFYAKYGLVEYQVDEGYYYEKEGEAKKAKKLFEKLIASDYKIDTKALALSMAFRSRSYYDYALEVLEKNKALNYENPNLHVMEISSLYYLLGKKDKALDMLLALATWEEQSYEMVLSQLPAFMQSQDDYNLLKTALLKKIRDESRYALIYEEMLSWVFIQQKDWNSAFIHYKSISKKKEDQGLMLMNLAQLCAANQAYDVTAMCYGYVMSLGKDRRYFHQAQSGWLDARYKAILNTPFPDTAALYQLETDFLTFIAEHKNNPFAAQAMRQLAEIYIKQLHNADKAISLLQEVVKLRNTTQRFIAECKLDLGDAYLFMGDVWESELLYAQVEKDFKEEPLGQEAKFRKARLAYFRGEFEWAETQLEVLKGATSQLIANNAIELSLTIQDNLGLDSNYVAMEAYAIAQLLLFQNKNEEALKTVEKINLLFPKHSLVDEVIYLKANVYARQFQWDKAIGFYKEIIGNHNNDILYDNALFELASIYENQFKDTVNAMKYYEELILKQPGSLFTVGASKKYRALRGDIIKEQENYYFEQ